MSTLFVILAILLLVLIVPFWIGVVVASVIHIKNKKGGCDGSCRPF